MASKNHVHYFMGHTIYVYSDHPLKSLLQQSDLSRRIARWVVLLGQFDIRYLPKQAIKGQVLADFVAKFVGV